MRVTRDCIYKWENNISKPQIHLLPKIIEFLGYVPFDFQKETFGDRIIAYRKEHGLSQRKLSKLLSVDQTTIRDWERNKHKPSRVLLEKVSQILL